MFGKLQLISRFHAEVEEPVSAVVLSPQRDSGAQRYLRKHPDHHPLAGRQQGKTRPGVGWATEGRGHQPGLHHYVC